MQYDQKQKKLLIRFIFNIRCFNSLIKKFLVELLFKSYLIPIEGIKITYMPVRLQSLKPLRTMIPAHRNLCRRHISLNLMFSSKKFPFQFYLINDKLKNVGRTPWCRNRLSALTYNIMRFWNGKLSFYRSQLTTSVRKIVSRRIIIIRMQSFHNLLWDNNFTLLRGFICSFRIYSSSSYLRNRILTNSN